MFGAKPVVGKMSRDARNLLHLLPTKIHSKTAYISNMCTHAAFVFSIPLGFAKSTAKKGLSFPRALWQIWWALQGEVGVRAQNS